MSVAVVTTERDSRAVNPTRLVHATCNGCFPPGTPPQVGLCGARLVGVECPPEMLECAVCADLHAVPCSRCGL